MAGNKSLNAANKANGSKDWETSREELKKALKATNDLENDIKKLDFTAGSAFSQEFQD